MNGRFGHVAVDSIAAETAKFTSQVIFVHGLWCTATVWHRFMGYMAHRGWMCSALHLGGRAGSNAGARTARARFADYRDDVAAVVAACETPPVVVGHDLGALLALHCAERARAVVALAPIVPASVGESANPLLPAWRSRLAAWSGTPLAPPRRAIERCFASEVPGGTVAASPRAVRELLDARFPVPEVGAVPALTVVGERDVASRTSDVQRLAQLAGASFLVLPDAGHGLPWERGWEKCISRVHRWIVTTLGEPLLALLEECDGDMGA